MNHVHAADNSCAGSPFVATRRVNLDTPRGTSQSIKTCCTLCRSIWSVGMVGHEGSQIPSATSADRFSFKKFRLRAYCT